MLQDLAVLSSQTHSSLGRWFYQIAEDEEELGRQVRELVDQCSRDHRQPRGGLLNFSASAIADYATGESPSSAVAWCTRPHPSNCAGCEVSVLGVWSDSESGFCLGNCCSNQRVPHVEVLAE